MPEDRLEQLLNEMRNECADAEEIAGAKARVWQKLVGAVSAACPEFRPEIQDYLADRLPASRRDLMDDHLTRCADCRRLLAETKGERKVFSMPVARPNPRAQWMRWAMAAGVALLMFYAGRERIDSALAPSGPRATVASVAGDLYRVSEGVLKPGAALNEGETVRTGPDSRAVLRLTDGSLVEVNERTELAVHAAWSGQSIQLERGDVIVQAAKQRRGHLRVVTRDSVVSVRGTIFAVSSGTAGTMVSVVEGSVQVAQPGGERLLKPGEQTASNPSLAAVSVRSAVAWSENADKYYALLGELVQLEKKIAEIEPQALRTKAELLPYLPASPLVYGAIPNVGGTIRQALWLIEERSNESPVLKEWWTSPKGEEMQKLLQSVQTVSAMLGDEIIFVICPDPAKADGRIPLLLAEVQPGRQESLKQTLANLTEGAERAMPYQVNEKLLLVSDSAAHLAALSAQLGRGASSEFAAEIARHYERGAGWLLALDAAAAHAKVEGEPDAVLGASQMKYVFFEQRSARGSETNEALLVFKGARKGLASWLAAPVAAGSAEYISSDAVLAVSASTRNPRQLFDEMVNMAGVGASSAVSKLREFEQEAGISVSNDIAAALGTDFTLAVERPSIPMPGWVAVFEVVQPALFDSTVSRLVQAANNHLAAGQQSQGVVLGQETVKDRLWTTLNFKGITVYMTHDRGYLIASADRALAARAIEMRNGGFNLVRSPRFQQNLPDAGSVNYSGFLWMNTDGALAALAGLAPNPALKSILENRDPLLVVMNGGTEQIQAVSRTRLTSLVLDLFMIGGPASGANAQPAAAARGSKKL